MTSPSAVRTMLVVAMIASATMAQEPCSNTLSFAELEALPVPGKGKVLAYGQDPLQFGELWLPDTSLSHPVVILVHGGCWRARYDLSHIRPLAEALRQAGFAIWLPEYRRVGDPGGGWPGTLQDIASAADALRFLESRRHLDLSRVLAMGHSAGGHLALWLAARPRLPKTSALYVPQPLPIAGVISLAGIPDLAYAANESICGSAVSELLGGEPQNTPERTAEASPAHLLPLGVPQRLLVGACDSIVPPETGRRYLGMAMEAGDEVHLEEIPEAGHFDLVSPGSFAWPTVLDAVKALQGLP